ncbi:hypothetical protein [Streptomyces phaeochromogenes]|uniref:hypothetical protein n=1 Tax=Streptomyces phaeochromogenes TaxID=1923 RepID=UPI0006E1702A|nr:hypothetical protein [Streptomyces phaeochromogenes]
MAKDRARKRKIRAELAVTGLTFNEASPAFDLSDVPDAGHQPPEGVAMADDPLGLGDGTELFTAPLMVVTMLRPAVPAAGARQGRQGIVVVSDDGHQRCQGSQVLIVSQLDVHGAAR